MPQTVGYDVGVPIQGAAVILGPFNRTIGVLRAVELDRTVKSTQGGYALASVALLLLGLPFIDIITDAINLV